MNNQTVYKVTVVGTIFRELLGVYKSLDHARIVARGAKGGHVQIERLNGRRWEVVR